MQMHHAKRPHRKYRYRSVMKRHAKVVCFIGIGILLAMGIYFTMREEYITGWKFASKGQPEKYPLSGPQLIILAVLTAIFAIYQFRKEDKT